MIIKYKILHFSSKPVVTKRAKTIGERKTKMLLVQTMDLGRRRGPSTQNKNKHMLLSDY
jgi:hypothetical protein